MCAGVGKTYTMLQVAMPEKLKGIDIIAGYVETHNRLETAELVKGFELVPRKTIEYKNTRVQEMDLDAIIARKPNIVLVDELAHTKCSRLQAFKTIPRCSGTAGERHKRIYYIERSASGKPLRNGGTVHRYRGSRNRSGRNFETADEVELIDLTPEELLQRLSEGKVVFGRKVERSHREFLPKR